MRSLIGEVLDSKYRIERQLGEGGMGAVYLATHLGTERPVALKVIAPQFMKHDEFVERFRREARAAGRLRHPNVVDVTDFGFAQIDGERVAYLVMEYLDGCTLDEILAEETSLPLNWVIDILEQTCSAVGEAHQQGIVHRDLKPDNIWLEPNRRGGYTVKVLDFGIAKLDNPGLPVSVEELVVHNRESDSFDSWRESESPTLNLSKQTEQSGAEFADAATLIEDIPGANAQSSEAKTRVFQPDVEASEAGTRILTLHAAEEADTLSLKHTVTDEQLGLVTSSTSSLTRFGSILGTPLYMSPEQCRGEASGARSDIYSLGVIAYRLLSGRTPFTGDVSTVMRLHREAAPPPLDVKRLPKKIAALVMSSLSKSPVERPNSAEAFASALVAHSNGAGALLQRALTLYAHHLPTFLRLALIVYAPVVVFNLLQVSAKYIQTYNIIPKPWSTIVNVTTGLLTFLVTFFSASVIIGMTAWLVTQALAMPLRPLDLRPAFSAIRKRLRPLMLTIITTNLMVLLGLALCVLPGLYLMCRFSLVAPTVMMEDLRGRAAMRRSHALFKRARRTVIAIVFLHIGVPILVAIATSVLIALVAKAVSSSGLKGLLDIVTIIQQLVSLPFTIFLSSFASVVTALLYWKTRLAGGETLRDALSQFVEEEAPSGKWQQKMRTRLQTPTRTTR